MLLIYRPDKLVSEAQRQEYIHRKREMDQSTVVVDRSRLSDKDYLRGLADDAAGEQGPNVQYITMQEYAEIEGEKTDLFSFLKYVCPSIYRPYFVDEEK